MVASLIADAASRLVCKDGVYHALSKVFMPTVQPTADDDDVEAEAQQRALA